VLCYLCVEPEREAGKGLLETLGARACIMVTDDYTAFFPPAGAGGGRLDSRWAAWDIGVPRNW
jgi:hypothetical protein